MDGRNEPHNIGLGQGRKNCFGLNLLGQHDSYTSISIPGDPAWEGFFMKISRTHWSLLTPEGPGSQGDGRAHWWLH